MNFSRLPFIYSNNILNTLSKAFALLSACLLVYILIKIVLIKKILSSENEKIITSNSIEQTDKLLPFNLPFTQYVQTLEGRNFFQLPKEKKPDALKIVQKDPPLQDLTKNIKILGIMLSQKPQVIVQNLLTNETSILSLGDKFNDLKLTDIQKEKIIFEHQGQILQVSP